MQALAISVISMENLHLVLVVRYTRYMIAVAMARIHPMMNSQREIQNP